MHEFDEMDASVAHQPPATPQDDRECAYLWEFAANLFLVFGRSGVGPSHAFQPRVARAVAEAVMKRLRSISVSW